MSETREPQPATNPSALLVTDHARLERVFDDTLRVPAFVPDRTIASALPQKAVRVLAW